MISSFINVLHLLLVDMLSTLLYTFITLPFEKGCSFIYKKKGKRECSSSSIEFKLQRMQSLYCGGVCRYLPASTLRQNSTVKLK